MTPNAFVIVGRTLANYVRCNVTVPAGFVILWCKGCNEALAVSAEGARQLHQKASEVAECKLVGALCLDCMNALPAPSDVVATEHGKKIIETSERARAVFEEMRRRVKP